MQKTTYLLGAGASVNALPAMVNLYQELSGFKCYLGKIQAANKTDWDPRIEIHLTDLQHLVDLIDELLENVQSHETVDTLARKYWLQSDCIILPESWTRGLVKKSLNLTKRYDQTNPTQIHA